MTVVGNIVILIDTFNIPNLGILDNAGRKAGRFDGFVGQPNSYGQILILFLAPTIALYLGETGKKRFFAALGIFAAALALLLTGSRGSWTGLIAGAIFAAFFLRNMISTKVLIQSTSIALLVITVVVIVAISVGYGEIFLQSIEKFEGGTNRATSGRATIWTNAILAMVEQPFSFITGFGFESYNSSRQFSAATHNVYLSYLYELGSIGVLLFVAIFVQILLVARRSTTTADPEMRRFLIALQFGLPAFLVAIFFSEYHSSSYLLWAYIGIAMRIAVFARNNSSEQVTANPRDGSAFIGEKSPRSGSVSVDDSSFATRRF